MNRFLNWRLGLIFLLVISAVVALIFLPTLRTSLGQFTDWVRENQILGAVALAAVYIPAALLFIPGSLITLVAGFSLGLVVGTIAMSVGSTLGACAAFWAGRTFARGFIERKIASNPRFQALDEGVGREGFKIVLLTRLSPAFPFNLLNYMFGLTRVRFRDYALASWIGMFPGTILYVYLGSAAGQISDLLSGELESTPAQRVLFFLGLVATVVVTILITRIARQALAKTSPQVAAAEPEAVHEPVHSSSPTR